MVSIGSCEVLGYSNTRQTIEDHCRDAGVSKRYTSSGGQQRELAFINECNLYRLIIKSRKDEAKRFESWVCDHVLPTLRKTGGYQLDSRSTAAARIANHRLRLAIGKELYRTRDPELRKLILQQLADVSNALGLPTPEIDCLGRSAPTMPDVLKAFWESLAFLDDKGVDYTTTPRPQTLWPSIYESWLAYSLSMANPSVLTQPCVKPCGKVTRPAACTKTIRFTVASPARASNAGCLSDWWGELIAKKSGGRTSARA